MISTQAFIADAKLYVILVTDEEDQSDGTAQLYVDFFRNLKGVGNPDLLNISAIAGPPPNGCDTAEGNQVDYDAVDAVGGQFRSICSADWSNMVGSLGLDVLMRGDNSRFQDLQLLEPSPLKFATMMETAIPSTANLFLMMEPTVGPLMRTPTPSSSMAMKSPGRVSISR